LLFFLRIFGSLAFLGIPMASFESINIGLNHWSITADLTPIIDGYSKSVHFHWEYFTSK
jgi:hypothetical protein